MRFTHYDLGHLHRGQQIQVTLSGSAANVRLMDTSNFNRYRRGQQHRYHGGLVKRSPWVGAAPRTGRWHVTVDMNGLRGTVRSSVKVLPGPLPTARSLTPARSPVRHVADNLGDLIGDNPREFDVFISHASEDKDDLVRPLAEALRSAGLEVWFDEFELRLGDSLRRKIDQGIAKARFGLVVLSPAFFAKQWTQYELDGIVTAQVTGKQIVLPIWHDVDRDDVFNFSPSLADKVAASTAISTVAELAREIVNAITE